MQVFPDQYNDKNLRFCPYTGKYGSEKTHILEYFTQYDKNSNPPKLVFLNNDVRASIRQMFLSFFMFGYLLTKSVFPQWVNNFSNLITKINTIHYDNLMFTLVTYSHPQIYLKEAQENGAS